jgi:hypothetical protein
VVGVRAVRIVVVGAGPAGLLAAARLRPAHEVDLVAAGEGSLALWPGWFAGEATDPAVLEAVGTLQQLGADLVALGRAELLIGPLGVPHRFAWSPAELARVAPGEAIVVVGFADLVETTASVVASTWSAATGATAMAIQVGPFGRRAPFELARWLGSEEGARSLAGALARRIGPGPEPVAVPGLLGMEPSARARSILAEAIGREVGEYPLVAPALSGWRLGRRLRRGLGALGVRMRRARVVGIEPGRLQLRGGGELVADGIVLATGGVGGGGLAVEPDGAVVDTARGVPVRSGAAWRAGAALGALGYGGVVADDGSRLVAVGAQRASPTSGFAQVARSVAEAMEVIASW